MALSYNFILLKDSSENDNKFYENIMMQSNLLITHLKTNQENFSNNIDLMKDFLNLINLATKKDFKCIKNSEWISNDTKKVQEYFINNRSSMGKEKILEHAIKTLVIIMTDGRYTNIKKTYKINYCKMQIVVIFQELFQSYINTERENLIDEYSFKKIIKRILKLQ